MKKLLIIMVTMSLLAVAAIAFASGFATGTQTLGSTTTMVFTSSNHVYVQYLNGTNGISYSIASYHQTGSRTYATSSGDSKIWYQDGTAIAPTTAGATASTSIYASPWKSL